MCPMPYNDKRREIKETLLKLLICSHFIMFFRRRETPTNQCPNLINLSRVSNPPKKWVSIKSPLKSWTIEYNFKKNQPYLSPGLNLSRGSNSLNSASEFKKDCEWINIKLAVALINNFYKRFVFKFSFFLNLVLFFHLVFISRSYRKHIEKFRHQIF